MSALEVCILFVAALAGGGINAIVGSGSLITFPTLLAIGFPTHLRATGTGIAIGAGRGGAALAPIIAGYLLNNGMSLQMVSIIMASGAMIGAVALMFVRYASTSEARIGEQGAPVAKT